MTDENVTPSYSLKELLDSVGINKSVLAKLLQVSRQTVQRMDDEVTDEVLAVIDQYKADMTQEQSESVPVPVANLVVNDSENIAYGILPVTHSNIALSRCWHDLDNVQVARRFNMCVFDYNQAVTDTVAYCMTKQTSFKELRV